MPLAARIVNVYIHSVRFMPGALACSRRWTGVTSCNMAKEPTTLHDIAKALGTSIGTVHRALHDNPGVSPKTKAKVLEAAKNLGYRPNLAARFLSSKKTLRVSINTLKGTTSFWDEVR